MLKRVGDVMTEVVPNQRKATLTPIIAANLIPGCAFHTEELRWHRYMTVKHNSHECVGNRGTSKNGIAGIWAAVAQGIDGTHNYLALLACGFGGI